MIIILDGQPQQQIYSNNTLQPDYGNCVEYSVPYGTHSTAAYQVPDENTAPNMVPTGNAYETGEQQQHQHMGMAGMPVNRGNYVGFAQRTMGFHNTNIMM